MKNIFLFVWHIPRNSFAGLVWLYQKTLSPDHSFWAKALNMGGYCQYHPTCSEYMRQALKKYGFIRGLLKGVYRILRCNPWSKGGTDRP